MSARLIKSEGQKELTLTPFTIPPQGYIHNANGETVEDENSSHSVTQIREEAEAAAQKLLLEAQQEAERLIATAQMQVDTIRQQAHEQGLQEARAQVDSEVNSAVEVLRAKLTNTLNELEQVYGLIAARAEQDLVQLSLAMARKIVHREVQTDPDIVLSLARVALSRLHPRAVATVRLHPDDYLYAHSHRELLSTSCTVEILADPEIGRGGCIVRSEHGDVDARIEQQFALIERGFFDN